MQSEKHELDPLHYAFIVTTIVIGVLLVVALCLCYCICDKCCTCRSKARQKEFDAHHNQLDASSRAFNIKRRGSDVSTDREVDEIPPSVDYDPENPDKGVQEWKKKARKISKLAAIAGALKEAEE